MDDSVSGAILWSDAGIYSTLTLTVHYGYSLAVEHNILVVHLLWCIVGLNECTQSTFGHHYKWLSP